MAKKKNRKFKKGFDGEKRSTFVLPREIKQMIFGVLLILIAIITGLSFFDKAGKAGQYFMKGSRFLIGETVFLAPLIFILAGFTLFKKGKNLFWTVILAVFILIFGIAGIIQRGWIGYLIAWPLLKYFGFWATKIIFSALIVIGALIFWHFLGKSAEKKEKIALEKESSSAPLASGATEDKPSIIKRIFGPKFKVREVPPIAAKDFRQLETPLSGVKIENKPAASGSKAFAYQPPPLNLLEPDQDVPMSGDTKINSSIIKKTLQNFSIEVAMSEINIGPTVTQYTFKPAEGVKLSKITGLSNDLALSLASHPIRIEAPIPGRSLVGIEVPNKARAQVRLRNLIESSNFQKSSLDLIIALGRDVSGNPVYADLTRMPHLLVAGSTGTGKTIFLNSLILSLLYQPSTSTKSAGPEILRFILVDPKRVEFPVYNKLPHLLCPVIYNAQQTIGALRWLTGEMERRFDLLSDAQARDIDSFNVAALKNNTAPLPFIVLIIDELADLMAAKGREIEAAIVRLAQMARAVGIHLVVATQRPSVEVITGLIKANITSRVTFQVASQVDSRTVLDTAGAEKLLGSGDLLYISAEIAKPKRIQGAYVSEKEVRKVAKHIESKSGQIVPQIEMEENLMQEMERDSERAGEEVDSVYNNQEDPLYEEAKKLVIESRKASASLLQRRLRVGYARAARLIDILENKGVVGPADGAKAREVFSDLSSESSPEPSSESPADPLENENNWEKV